MPICSQCGADNPDWARFCDQCGAPLKTGAIPGATPPVPPNSGTITTPPNQCPQCGASVIPGEAFCDSCGTPLTQPAPVNSSAVSSSGVPPQQHYPPPQPVQMPATPPSWGASPPPAPASVPPTPRGARLSHPLASAHLHVVSANIMLPLPVTDQIVIGREDAISGIYPDIDLTAYQGIERGVGRRHAQLMVRQGQVLVEDMDSTNGSYLNGQRLLPHSPQPIQSGDELRLGTLALRLEY